MSHADRAFLREISLFRPYPDAVPWSLIEQAKLSDAASEQLAAWIAAALDDDPAVQLRVARMEDEPVALYLLLRPTALVYQLVYLQVAESRRRRGVGRWVLGHALGLAESKGGRSLEVVDCPPLARFLKAYGFAPKADDPAVLAFDFTPE